VLVENAVAKPLAVVSNEVGLSQEITLAGKQIDTGLLPVPTFFEHDSGPFLTGAIGISRNPSNNVLNAGYYRVLIIGADQVALSVSPTSDLLRFIQADKKADRSTQVALVVGGPASLAIAAAAKVPADVSELDVAGALDGTHMEVVQATNSDLLVPAEAEFIIEITLDHAECIPNTMGEFGDLYGSQTAQVATVTAITHRENALFHVVMAGAGREHNNLGMPVLYEVTMGLREQLQTSHPDVKDCRVLFDPPSMGTTGEIYVQLSADAEIDAARLAREIYAMKCGRYDLARVIHKVLVVDADININSNLELRWAVNNRATADERYQLIDDLQAAGGKLRVAIDATVRSEDRETLQRLITPDAENVRLDDYLGDAAGNSNK
jgi:UbiD family decarboxylase